MLSLYLKSARQILSDSSIPITLAKMMISDISSILHQVMNSSFGRFGDRTIRTIVCGHCALRTLLMMNTIFLRNFKKPDCIGVFICFTAKRMMWVIKKEGQSWNGEYLREEILTAKVIPFLKDPNNTLDATEVCFLHDKAPCFKANVTQDLLRRSGIDFFGSSE